MVGRWQHDRAVGGKNVRNAQPFCHRASGDLEGCCCQDNVAALGCRRDRLELGRDYGFRQLPQELGRGLGWHGRLAGGGQLAQLGANGYYGDTEAVDPLVKVRRSAQANLLTESLQLHRQCQQRLHIAPGTRSLTACASQLAFGTTLVVGWSAHSEREPACRRLSVAVSRFELNLHLEMLFTRSAFAARSAASTSISATQC